VCLPRGNPKREGQGSTRKGRGWGRLVRPLGGVWFKSVPKGRIPLEPSPKLLRAKREWGVKERAFLGRKKYSKDRTCASDGLSIRWTVLGVKVKTLWGKEKEASCAADAE